MINIHATRQKLVTPSLFLYEVSSDWFGRNCNFYFQYLLRMYIYIYKNICFAFFYLTYREIKIRKAYVHR